MNEEQKDLVERARELQGRAWDALMERLAEPEAALLRAWEGLQLHCNVLEGYYRSGAGWGLEDWVRSLAGQIADCKLQIEGGS